MICLNCLAPSKHICKIHVIHSWCTAAIFSAHLCVCVCMIYLNNSAFVIEFLFIILPRFSDNNQRGRWPLCREASREMTEIVFLGRNAMIVSSSVGSVRNQAGGMTQWAKAIAAKLDGLCLIPGTHTGKRKNQLMQVVLWTTHTHTSWCECEHACTHK